MHTKEFTSWAKIHRSLKKGDILAVKHNIHLLRTYYIQIREINTNDVARYSYLDATKVIFSLGPDAELFDWTFRILDPDETIMVELQYL